MRRDRGTRGAAQGGALRALMVVIAAGSLTDYVSAAAQDAGAYRAPRTIHGVPSFEGVWATAFVTPIERPAGVEDLVVTPEQAQAIVAERSSGPLVRDPDVVNFRTNELAVVRGEFRSSLVVTPENGRLPYSQHALEILAARDAKARLPDDNPEDRRLIDRCLTGSGQPPFRPSSVLMPSMIVQTRDALVLWTEDVGPLRIVHLSGAPPPENMRTFEGWSSGRWEGDTLVIQTTHLRGDDPYRYQMGRPILVGKDSKVIERLTRLSDTELLLQFTIEDPTLYDGPWLAEFSFTRTDLPIFEYACQEANYSLTNILLASRVNDKKVSEKSDPP